MAVGLHRKASGMTSRKTSGKTTRRSASNLKMSRRGRPAEGGMTVREAGRLGGLIGRRKGGLAVKAERGVEFFQEIGRLGGQRVRDLIAAGRKAAQQNRRKRQLARAGR